MHNSEQNMTLEIPHDKIKVLDTALYQPLSENQRAGVIAEDVAGLVIEAGDRPLHQRINPRKLKMVGERVFDPATGSNVLKEFAYNTPLQRKETRGAAAFYSRVIGKPEGTLIFSLSPMGGPANYIESRINVAVRNGEDIEFYGIPSRIEPESLLNYAIRLSEWNTESFTVENPEELRKNAFCVTVPKGINRWAFLKENFPVDSDAWESIMEGLPWQIKQKAIEDASWVAAEMAKRLSNADSEHERILIGAWGEQMMESMGWKLNTSACPGLFNSQLIEAYGSQNGPFAVTDSFGNLRLTGGTGGEGVKYIESCGVCKRHLGMYMKAGDHCPHCQEVYEGC